MWIVLKRWFQYPWKNALDAAVEEELREVEKKSWKMMENVD